MFKQLKYVRRIVMDPEFALALQKVAMRAKEIDFDMRAKEIEFDMRAKEVDFDLIYPQLKYAGWVAAMDASLASPWSLEAAVKDAEKTRRAKEEASIAIAVARAELDALRRKISDLEAAANAAPEVAAALAERMAKERALSDLRAKLVADAVAGLTPAYNEADETEKALLENILAEDEEAKELNRIKEEAAKERSTVGARRQEIDTELRKLYDKTAEIESVKALSGAADAASKAYDQAYATSDIQKLLEAQSKAAESLSKKTAELRKADEKGSELNARIAEVRGKVYAISAEIRELGR